MAGGTVVASPLLDVFLIVLLLCLLLREHVIDDNSVVVALVSYFLQLHKGACVSAVHPAFACIELPDFAFARCLPGFSLLPGCLCAECRSGAPVLRLLRSPSDLSSLWLIT